MQTLRNLMAFIGLAGRVAFELVRPPRPENRLPARWVARRI